MITQKMLDEFKEYLESGRWEEDFGYRTEDGKGEMLDMIDTICDICDLANEIISRKFYEKMGGLPHGDSAGPK